jgi:cysteinyl-tRNA synthetase
MMTVNGIKMGKSLGNFTTVKEAISRHSPMTIRFFILNSHYRSPTDFTEAALEAAGKGHERLISAVGLTRQLLADADPNEAPDERFLDIIQEHQSRFLAAMDDDFNTPQALAVLFDFNREVNTLLNEGAPVSGGTLKAIDALYRELGDEILGIIPQNVEATPSAGMESDLIQLIADLRAEARARKDWKTSDTIRDRLTEIGVILEDRPEGTTWRLKR